PVFGSPRGRKGVTGGSTLPGEVLLNLKKKCRRWGFLFECSHKEGAIYTNFDCSHKEGVIYTNYTVHTTATYQTAGSSQPSRLVTVQPVPYSTAGSLQLRVHPLLKPLLINQERLERRRQQQQRSNQWSPKRLFGAAISR